MNIPAHRAQEIKDWLYGPDGPYAKPRTQVIDETHVWDAEKMAEVERWIADRPGRFEDTA